MVACYELQDVELVRKHLETNGFCVEKSFNKSYDLKAEKNHLCICVDVLGREYNERDFERLREHTTFIGALLMRAKIKKGMFSFPKPEYTLMG